MTASPVRSMRAMSKTGTDSSVTGERGDTASSAATAFASACAAAGAAEPSSREPDAGGETAGAAVAALVSTGGSRRRCMKPTTSAATHAATSAKYGTAVRPIDVAVIIHDPWLERWLVSPRVEPCADLFRSSSPPNGVSPPPHSAHTSADVDALPLARSTRRGARHRQRPRRQFKQPEQTIWNEPRPRGIDVAVTSRMLTVREEALRHDQMQIVLGAGHGDVEKSAFFLEFGARASAQVGRQAAIDHVEHEHRFPFLALGGVDCRQDQVVLVEQRD